MKLAFASHLLYRCCLKKMSEFKKLCPREVLGVDFVLNMVYKAKLKKIPTQEVHPLNNRRENS